MDAGHLIDEFQSLSPAAQVEVLVRLAFELTIVGRDAAYEVGSLVLRCPERLRCLNEVQHRVTSHALALLTADPARYPDEALMTSILEQDDPELRRQIKAALARSLPSHAAV